MTIRRPKLRIIDRILKLFLLETFKIKIDLNRLPKFYPAVFISNQLVFATVIQREVAFSYFYKTHPVQDIYLQH